MRVLRDGDSQPMIAAVLAPGQQKSIGINDLHYVLGHAHEGILRATAKDMGTKVTGNLGVCGGCASAKGIKASVAKSTECRAKRPLERLFADLTGPKSPSVGGQGTAS